MKGRAEAMWRKALDSYRASRYVLEISPDAAASRAYYAAFHAVSACFGLQDKSFSKHTALEAAVHRDLVRPGLWAQELGKFYSQLLEQRDSSDYGFDQSSSVEQAAEAIVKASRILRAVQQMHPDLFADPESLLKDNKEA